MIFSHYDIYLNSLIKSFGSISYSSLLSTIEKRSFIAEHMKRYLNPSDDILNIKQGDHINPFDIYNYLLHLEGFSEVISTYINSSNLFIVAAINESTLLNKSLDTKIQNIKHKVDLVSLYIGRPDKSLKTFRLYTKAAKALPSHTDSVEEKDIDSVSSIENGKLKDSISAYSNKLSKFQTKKGKAELKLESQLKSTVNGLAFNFGKSSSKSKVKIDKVETEDENGSRKILSSSQMLFNEESANGVIHFNPSYTNSIIVHVSSDETEDNNIVADFKLMKVKYKGDGLIQEREFTFKENIEMISITKERFILAAEVRSYFEIKHEILLDGHDKWLRIRPRNSNDYNNDIPEVIIIGGTFDSVGILNVKATSPILKFKYRASFKKIKEIPQHVLNNIYIDNKDLEDVIESHKLKNGENTLHLNDEPFDKPTVLIKQKAKVVEDYLQGDLLGYNNNIDSLQLHEHLLSPAIQDKLIVSLGDKKLTRSNNSSPGLNEYFINEKGIIELNDLQSAASPIRTSIPVEFLELKTLTSNNYQATFETPIYALRSDIKIYNLKHKESFANLTTISSLVKVTNTIYAWNVSSSYLNAVTYKNATLNGQDITSTVWQNQKPYITGLENTNAGDYSIDTRKGIIYINIAGLDISTLLKIEYDFNEYKEYTNWKLIDNRNILLNNPTLEQYYQIINSGMKEVPLSFNLNDEHVILDSIKIKGYSMDNSIEARHKSSKIVLYRDSYVSNVSYFKMPFLPIDTSDTPDIIVNGSVYLGNVIFKDDTIGLPDSTNIYRTIVISYSFIRTEPANIDKLFSYNKSTNTIIFAKTLSESVRVTYSTHTLHAEYTLATVLKEHLMEYIEETKSINILTAGGDKDVLVKYKKTKKTSSDSTTLSDQYVTVFPKYVDLEVKLIK